MNKLFKIKYLLTLLLLLFINIGNILYAQNVTIDTSSLSSSKKTQKDVSDLYRSITKKAKTEQPDTIKKKSLGPFWTPIIYPGYAMVLGYMVGLTNSVSFYTDRNNDAKISSILLNNVYSQYKQIMNILNTNLWLDKERFNLQGDWRYYQFPTNTFGLGSKTSLSDADAIDYSYLRIYEIIVTKIAGNLSGGIGYNLDYHWNITETKKSAETVTDLDKYGLTNSSMSSGITLNLQFDSRLNSINPSDGLYANLQIRDNLKSFGSNSNWQSLLLDARYFIKTSQKTGNVLAFWTYDYLTLSGTPPYFDLPTTGLDAYDNTARGYVEGRFKGRDLIYAESEYRFGILRNELLGGVVFINASTLPEWPSNKFEAINPGYGVGIRIKMNKKSNANLCIDYAIGTGGSRGFAFNLGEVF